MTRKDSGNLGLTAMGDSARMLHGELEHVGQTLGGGRQEASMGNWAVQEDFRLGYVKGSSGRWGWKEGRALNLKLKMLYSIHIGWRGAEGLSKAMACSNLCSWKIYPEGCRQIIYETPVIIQVWDGRGSFRVVALRMGEGDGCEQAPVNVEKTWNAVRASPCSWSSILHIAASGLVGLCMWDHVTFLRKTLCKRLISLRTKC